MTTYDEYVYLLPEENDIFAVVDTTKGSGYYGSNFVGLGFTYNDALKDAARKYKSISLDPSDYNIEKSYNIDFQTDKRHMYLYHLDPLFLFSSILNNITLEKSIGYTKRIWVENDEFLNYSQKIREMVIELNTKNKFTKYYTYYNYFSMYADNPEDTALKEKFDELTEEFANKYPNMRFSLFCGRFAGTTAKEAIKDLLYRYNMEDTALAELTPEKIPKNAYGTDTDAQSNNIEFMIPCEVLNIAKQGDALEELITYWSEFSGYDFYNNLIDEADSMINAGNDE